METRHIRKVNRQKQHFCFAWISPLGLENRLRPGGFSGLQYECRRWKLAGGVGFASAVGADSADFRAANGYFDAGVARDLALQVLVELAFHFANLAAADARHVDVVARSMALIEVAVAAQVKQIEFVDQSMTLEKINCSIDSNARDFRIDFLCAIEDFACIQMPSRGFHYL